MQQGVSGFTRVLIDEADKTCALDTNVLTQARVVGVYAPQLGLDLIEHARLRIGLAGFAIDVIIADVDLTFEPPW